MNGDISMVSNVDISHVEDQIVWPVHVEVRLTQRSSMPSESVRKLVRQHIMDNYERLFMPTVLTGWESCSTLGKNVERIVVSDSVCSQQSLAIEKCSLNIHVYQPSENSTYERMSTNPSDPSEEYTAGTMTDLPSKELEGLWESLFYDGDVKSRLLNYISATIGFSDAGVDSNLVSWNRVVLLHGPPGTGKTSLCRALAQKLSIRLKERYTKTHLFEINSHSLFSRWFSESGKLVQNLFSTVGDMAREEEDFVVLLIDEVESLTAARAGAMSGTEPSDALRVVNALLTQIDRLKHQKNVLIMATSNLAKAIDSAFVDRADIAQYIDYPPSEAVYEILRSSLVELMRKGIIVESDVPASESALLAYKVNASSVDSEEQNAVKTLNRLSLGPPSDKLELSRFVAHACSPSPRNAKVYLGDLCVAYPFSLMHAISALCLYPKCLKLKGNIQMGKLFHISKDMHNISEQISRVTSSLSGTKPAVPIEVWLNAMQKVVVDEADNRQRFQC